MNISQRFEYEDRIAAALGKLIHKHTRPAAFEAAKQEIMEIVDDAARNTPERPKAEGDLFADQGIS